MLSAHSIAPVCTAEESTVYLTDGILYPPASRRNACPCPSSLLFPHPSHFASSSVQCDLSAPSLCFSFWCWRLSLSKLDLVFWIYHPIFSVEASALAFVSAHNSAHHTAQIKETHSKKLLLSHEPHGVLVSLLHVVMILDDS